jgi:hypothetical protein
MGENTGGESGKKWAKEIGTPYTNCTQTSYMGSFGHPGHRTLLRSPNELLHIDFHSG